MKKLLYIIYTCFFLVSFQAQAAVISSQTSGDWSNVLTWVGGAVPGSSDVAFIKDGHSVTVTSNASVASLRIDGSTAGTTTLTINNGVTLTNTGFGSINPTTATSETVNLVINGQLNSSRLRMQFLKNNFTVNVSGTGSLACSIDFYNVSLSSGGVSNISVSNVSAKILGVHTVSGINRGSIMNLHTTAVCTSLVLFTGAVSADTKMDITDVNSDITAGRISASGNIAQLVANGTNGTLTISGTSGITNNSNLQYPNTIISGNSTLSGGALTSNFQGNLTIDANGTLNTNGNDFAIPGDLVHNGTVTMTSGDKISLAGSTAQTITVGATASPIGGLEIANTSGGVSISGGNNLQVSEQVSFDAIGTTAFTTNGKLVLLDTASGMANLGNLNNHTITGNITCQFKSNTLTNVDYRLMSMPVTGVTIADVQFNAGTQAGGFATYGFTGSNTPSAGGFFSSYTYNNASVTTDFSQGFIGATGTGESMNHLIASTWYIGPSRGTGSSYNFQVTGSPNSGTIVINNANGARMTATGTGFDPQVDWALIGNPYPSTVTLTGTELSGIDPNVWQFKADGGGYVEDKTLAPFQGFYVFQTGGVSSVTFNESNKVTTRKVFQKSSENKDMVNIFITSEHTNKWSFASVQVKKGATNKYDIGLDAGRIINPNPWPNLALITEDSVASQRFYGDESGGHLTIPVNTVTYKSGNHKLRFENVSDLNGCMVLEDMALNKMIAINDINNTYSFYLSDTVKKDRFKLHIYKFAKELTSSNASCFDKNDGMVELDLFDLGSDYFYELSDQSGKNIASELNAKGKQNIKNLEPGNYTFVIQSNGLTCPVSKEYFSILEPSEMKPDFGYKGNSTVFYNNKDIEFENKSLGGIATYVWDFGDKSFDSRENPTHTYTAPGIYTIMLTSQNGNADCDVSASGSINVIDAYLSVSELSDDNVEVIQLNDKLNVIAKLSFDEFKIVDLSGKLVLEGDVSNQNNFEINLSKLNGGIYILHLNGNEKPYTLKFYKK